MKSESDTVYLPLVAREVKSANSALSATKSEGADFLIMSMEGVRDSSCLPENALVQLVKVPVFLNIVESVGGDMPINLVMKLFESGAAGMVMSIDNLKLFGAEVLKKIFSTAYVADRIVQDGNLHSSISEIHTVRDTGDKQFAGFSRLDVKEIQLIESEKLLLMEAVNVIEEAAPMVIFLILTVGSL